MSNEGTETRLSLSLTWIACATDFSQLLLLYEVERWTLCWCVCVCVLVEK